VPDEQINDVTRLLQQWTSGNEQALEALIPSVYDELHRLAHQYIRKEYAENLLDTTSLVNEAYLRLVDARNVDWQDRAHFLSIAARLMRQILVDYARSRNAQKRGGGAIRVSMDAVQLKMSAEDADVVALHEALSSLETFDERKAKVIELRFFGGLTVDETAQVLGISSDSVLRDWRLARSWLMNRLESN
jgi:RNA polymerase sigma factor (TIGR02999 family)